MKSLPVNEIRDLYENKKLSSTKIAEIYSCSKATILKRLRKTKVSMRSSGMPRLQVSDARLRMLYVDRRLSTWKIAELLECGRPTIHRKLKKLGLMRDIATAHIVYPRKHFSGNAAEKAYLIGFAIGDLRARKVGKNSKTIKVDCGSTKEEQIILIRDLFSDYGRVWISKPTGAGKVQIEAALDDSFAFLLHPRQELPALFRGGFFMQFLAGFTDAEGSIFITNAKAAYSLGNYDSSLLKRIRKKLVEYGLDTVRIYKAKKRYTTKEGYTQKHIYWRLAIHRKDNLLKLFNMLGPHIRHAKRKADMQKALNNISLRNAKVERGDAHSRQI